MYIKAVHAAGAYMYHYQIGNAVHGTQLVKVCYYSITHSSASHVSPKLDRLPALPLQVWLTGLEQDGPPTPTFPS